MSHKQASSLDLKVIGKRIRTLRGELSQDEFAAAMGVSQGQLSKIEHGRMGPTLEMLIRLSSRYGKSLDWIVLGRS